MLELRDVLLDRGEFRLEADFTLPAGRRAAVIGPSGGGKSTLLNVIAGFEVVDRGKVLWEGSDLTGRLPGARPISVLFQDNNLFPHLDLRTNVALGIAPVARPGAEALARADAALGRVGLTGFEARKPGDVSGGQQSRTALARVLLTAKPVVLLDEPFAALGPALRRDMLELVEELLPSATILMVTHDPDDARSFADDLIFVDGGKVLAPEPVEVAFANPSEALAAYLE